MVRQLLLGRARQNSYFSSSCLNFHQAKTHKKYTLGAWDDVVQHGSDIKMP